MFFVKIRYKTFSFSLSILHCNHKYLCDQAWLLCHRIYLLYGENGVFIKTKSFDFNFISYSVFMRVYFRNILLLFCVSLVGGSIKLKQVSAYIRRRYEPKKKRWSPKLNENKFFVLVKQKWHSFVANLLESISSVHFSCSHVIQLYQIENVESFGAYILGALVQVTRLSSSSLFFWNRWTEAKVMPVVEWFMDARLKVVMSWFIDIFYIIL